MVVMIIFLLGSLSSSCFSRIADEVLLFAAPFSNRSYSFMVW